MIISYFWQKICARNAANQNNAKNKGTAINHHSGTTLYSYRVAAHAAKGHAAPILQTVCEVYEPSPNAKEKVVSKSVLHTTHCYILLEIYNLLKLTPFFLFKDRLKRKMDEMVASRMSEDGSGSYVTGSDGSSVPVDDQMAVVEQEMGGSSVGTYVRGKFFYGYYYNLINYCVYYFSISTCVLK